jgi:UDPglucose 6-dehydrogenase
MCSCQCGKRLVEATNEKIAVRKHGGVSIGSGVGDAGAGARCRPQDALVASNVEAGRLSFATESAAAIRAADAIFLAVGTPSRRGDGFADLSYVYDAAREIAAEIEGFTVIAIKSTVPVGTNDEVDAIVRKPRPDADFTVVSNPEFLREGAAIEDFKRPDRVVVGTDDEA